METLKNLQIIKNEEKNGIELYFNSKPENAVLANLKGNGFRWHNTKKCWYNKLSDVVLNFIKTLSNQEIETSQDEEVEQPQTQIKEISHIWNYGDEVNNAMIIKTIDDEIERTFSSKNYYIEDQKILIQFYRGQISYTDINNALQSGKTCNKKTFTWNSYDRNFSYYSDLWNNHNIRNLKDLIDAINSNTLKKICNSYSESELKAIKTFSPFAQPNRVKKPSKWNLSHIWKAILNGQIYKITTNYYYTDDYASDYASDYRNGISRNLLDFAYNMIENNYYNVYEKTTSNNGDIVLSIHTSWSSYTAIFNENLNAETSKIRQEKEHNKHTEEEENKKQEILNIKRSDIKQDQLYNIDHYEEDTNTKQLKKVINTLVLGSDLFYSYEEEDESEYKKYNITKINEYDPQDKELFVISDFYSRPQQKYFDEDVQSLMIGLGNWKFITTGENLKKLIAKNIYLSTIRKETESMEKIKQDQINRLAGKSFWGFTFANDGNNPKLALEQMIKFELIK